MPVPGRTKFGVCLNPVKPLMREFGFAGKNRLGIRLSRKKVHVLGK